MNDLAVYKAGHTHGRIHAADPDTRDDIYGHAYYTSRCGLRWTLATEGHRPFSEWLHLDQCQRCRSIIDKTQTGDTNE